MDFQLKNKVMLIAGASKGSATPWPMRSRRKGRRSRPRRGTKRRLHPRRRESARHWIEGVRHVGRRQIRRAIQKWIGATADKSGGIDGLMTNSGGPPPGWRFRSTTRPGRKLSCCFSARYEWLRGRAGDEIRGGGAILVSTSCRSKSRFRTSGCRRSFARRCRLRQDAGD